MSKKQAPTGKFRIREYKTAMNQNINEGLQLEFEFQLTHNIEYVFTLHIALAQNKGKLL